MKKLITSFCAGLLLLANIALAGEAVRYIDAMEFGGSTTEFCNGHGWSSPETGYLANLGKRSWVNNTGRTLRVYQTSIMVGMDYGTTADFLAWVWKTPAMELLTPILIWDHYQQPAAPSTFHFPVGGGNYIELLPGDGLELWVYCQPFATVKKAPVSMWTIFVNVNLQVNK